MTVSKTLFENLREPLRISKAKLNGIRVDNKSDCQLLITCAMLHTRLRALESVCLILIIMLQNGFYYLVPFFILGNGGRGTFGTWHKASAAGEAQSQELHSLQSVGLQNSFCFRCTRLTAPEPEVKEV